MSQLMQITKRTYSRKAFIAVVVLSLFGAGIAYAATNVFSSNEAEAGARASAASLIADTTAAGGAAIRFGTGASGISCPVADRVTVTSANKTDYPAYPVGTKVYTPDGPDPWAGCFPGPLSTGVPAGTVLTNYTGSCDITTANTVIDKKIVNCDLLVRASNLTITNSKIEGQVRTNDCSAGNSFSITDSTIHYGWLAMRALMSCNYTATRVDASGGGSMAICANCTIKDSYFHDPLEDPTGDAHNSTVRLGDHAILEHNTLWCKVKGYPDGSGGESGCSANQTAYSHDGLPPYNTTSKRNFYRATTGGYCGYGGSTSGDLAAVHDVKFIENIFERGNSVSDWQPGPIYMCGYWGPMTSFDSSRPGNEFTGNRWDNGKPFIIEGTGWQQTWMEPCTGAPSNCTW